MKSLIRRAGMSDGNCSGTTMEQTTPAAVIVDRDKKVVVSGYAWTVPWFHEDYYGPVGHESNHHANLYLP
jgi:hypothetical protein